MKSILLLITLLLIAADLYHPDDSFLKILRSKQVTTCSIVYDEEDESIVFEDSLANCNMVEIHSVPPPSTAEIPVKARFIKGSYSLILSKSVALDVACDYVLEDLLTGKTFNLKSEVPYTFNVSRTIPGRFLLHVKKSGMAASK